MKIEPTKEPQTAIEPSLPAAAYLSSLRTDSSRRGQTTALNNAARAWVGVDRWEAAPWASLTAAHVDGIMAKIEGAPSTRNKTLSSLKGVAKAAWRLDLINTDQYQRILDTKGDRGTRELAGRHIPAGETDAIMRTICADLRPSGIRDACLFGLAISTGARRGELAFIQLENIIRDDEGTAIQIVGKGNRQRKLFISNGCLEAMQAWLEVRGQETGPLVCQVPKGGKRILVDRGLSHAAMDKVLKRRLSQAGISTPTTWHDFRRTVTSTLLDRGVDVVTVARIMGHASITTTQGYCRRGERAAREASELISVPYFTPALDCPPSPKIETSTPAPDSPPSTTAPQGLEPRTDNGASTPS